MKLKDLDREDSPGEMGDTDRIDTVDGDIGKPTLSKGDLRP